MILGIDYSLCLEVPYCTGSGITGILSQNCLMIMLIKLLRHRIDVYVALRTQWRI